MAKQAGDELSAGAGELIGGAGLVEGVGVALEKAEVGVHPRAGELPERLGHDLRGVAEATANTRVYPLTMLALSG